MFGLATEENTPLKNEGEEGEEQPEYWVTDMTPAR